MNRRNLKPQKTFFIIFSPFQFPCWTAVNWMFSATCITMLFIWSQVKFCFTDLWTKKTHLQPAYSNKKDNLIQWVYRGPRAWRPLVPRLVGHQGCPHPHQGSRHQGFLRLLLPPSLASRLPPGYPAKPTVIGCFLPACAFVALLVAASAFDRRLWLYAARCSSVWMRWTILCTPYVECSG